MTQPIQQTPVTDFTKFPTLFGQSEQDLLKSIESKNTEMANLWNTKFNPQSWAATNPVEKAVRAFVKPGIFLNNLAQLAPSTWGFDWGTTPETFKPQFMQNQQEYQDLLRRQQVVSLVPSIQESIRAMALSGDTAITDRSQLTSMFKLNELGFNKQEQDWITNYAAKMATATPEQLVSGNPLGLQPLTDADIASLMRSDSGNPISPSLILSTVAFSKNQIDISNALKEAYPPQGNQSSLDIRKVQILKAFNDQVSALNGAAHPDIKTGISNLMDKAAQDGQPIVLTDSNGGMIPARLLPDNRLVGTDNMTIGYLDKNGQDIHPMNPQDGQPLDTPEKKINFFQSLWNNIYTGMNKAAYDIQLGFQSVDMGIMQWLTSDVPSPEALKSLGLTADQWKAKKAVTQDPVAQYQSNQMNQLRTLHADWLQKHKDMLPRQDQGTFLDVINSLPSMLVGIGLTIGAGAIDPMLGAATGAGYFTSQQAGGLNEQLTQMGVPQDQAATLTTQFAATMLPLNILPGAVEQKLISPLFQKTLMQNVEGEFVKEVGKYAAIKAVGTTFAGLEVSGQFQGLMQTAVQNAYLKTVDSNRSLLEGLGQTEKMQFWSMFPIAVASSGGRYLQIQPYLKSKDQARVDTMSKLLQDAGVDKKTADIAALSNLASTETGKAEIKLAQDKAISDINLAELQYQANKQEAQVFGGDIIKEGNQYRAIKNDMTSKLFSESDSALQSVKNEPIFKPAPIPTETLTGEQIAQRLGIKYDGIQTGDVKLGIPDKMQFTDSVTGSTTYGNTLEEVLTNIDKMRHNFVESQPKQTPQEIVSSAKQERVTFLQNRLSEVTNDINNWQSSITAQEARKAGKSSGEQADIQAGIDNLKGLIQDSLAQKNKYQGQLDKLSKIEIPPVSSEPKVTTTATPGVLTPTDTVIEASIKRILAKQKGITPEQKVVENQGTIPDIANTIQPTPNGGNIPIGLDNRPRLPDWQDERQLLQEGLAKNQPIRDALYHDPQLMERQLRAENVWNNASEEQKLALLKSARKLDKTVLAKSWTDMTEYEHQLLTLATIPNGSLTIPGRWELANTSQLFRKLQELTGMPFHDILVRIRSEYGIARKNYHDTMMDIASDPHFDSIRTDQEALIRVAQELNSRNPAENVQSPPDITPNELLLVDRIAEIYKSYEPKVRYMRIIRTKSDLPSLQKEFPDAPVADLQQISDLIAQGDYKGLWNFQKDLNWGVIQQGYDPRTGMIPNLYPQEANVDNTRGESRLMPRQVIDPTWTEKNVLQRLSTYIRQIESQWLMRDDLNLLGDSWDSVAHKFSNAGELEGGLKGFSREVQSMAYDQKWAEKLFVKVYKQAMIPTFSYPTLLLRNLPQILALYPDRTELVKLATHGFKPTTDEVFNTIADNYYKTNVNQLEALKTEFLFNGQKLWKVNLPGGKEVDPTWILDQANRLNDKISLYTFTDDFPRHYSFNAALMKAMRATDQYIKDKNVEQWRKDSGVIHLTMSEQNKALMYLSQEDNKASLGSPALDNVSGYQQASLFIAHEISDLTNNVYERPFRGVTEMGSSGRNVFNLLVYPRGYAQRILFNFDQAIKSAKEAGTPFTPKTWDASKDVIGMYIAGEVVSRTIQLITGDYKKKAYSPFDLLNWQAGGLSLGSVNDLLKFLKDIASVFTPNQDPEVVKRSTDAMITDLKTVNNLMLPFYKITVDTLDNIYGTKNIDAYVATRLIRGFFDTNYNPAKMSKVERTTQEQIQKIIWSTETGSPDKFNAAKQTIVSDEEQLGQLQPDGTYYTMDKFGNAIENNLKTIPPAMLSSESGFSPLVEFKLGITDLTKPYYQLASSPSVIRTEWRKSHILEEAAMLFWGMQSKSVFTVNSKDGQQVMSLIRQWATEYNISSNMLPQLDSWAVQ